DHLPWRKHLSLFPKRLYQNRSKEVVAVASLPSCSPAVASTGGRRRGRRRRRQGWLFFGDRKLKHF
ncbi:MAG TPA: hypothetical protein VK625_02590, partial [Flavitalea sp.]|nr:hypothetical protein [Flavitalea sp.]